MIAPEPGPSVSFVESVKEFPYITVASMSVIVWLAPPEIVKVPLAMVTVYESVKGEGVADEMV